MTIDRLNEHIIPAAREMQQNLGKSIRHRSIWIDGIRRSTWPDGEGYRVDLTPADGGQSTPEAAEFPGSTLRSYSLVQKRLPDLHLCIAGIRDSRQFMDDLAKTSAILTDCAAYAWRRRAESEYTRLSRKILSAEGYPGGYQDFPVIHPTMSLDSCLLGEIRTGLKTLGATPHDIVDNEPRFLLVGDRSTPAFEGFVTHVENYPRRWKIEDNQWVEIPPYLSEEKDGGTVTKENPEYRDATVQDTPVLISDVMEIVVPRPVTWQGEFDPMDYAASVTWINILDADPESEFYNPDGTKGRFISTIQCATKPMRPEHGVVIRHLR